MDYVFRVVSTNNIYGSLFYMNMNRNWFLSQIKLDYWVCLALKNSLIDGPIYLSPLDAMFMGVISSWINSTKCLGGTEKMNEIACR